MKKEMVSKLVIIGLVAAISGVFAFFASPAIGAEPNKPAVDTKKAPAAEQRRPMRGSQMEMLTEKLNLTPEQQAKIKPIIENERKEMKALMDDKSVAPDQRRSKMQEIRKNASEQINKELTPDQQKKYAELRASGPGEMVRNALARGDRMGQLTERLNLTTEQQAKIKPVLENEAKEMKAIMDDKSIPLDQKRAKRMDILKTSNEQISKELTPEQQKKFEEMSKQGPERRMEAMKAHKPADSNSKK